MITATIIFGSVVLALAYAAVWIFVPRVRGQIEQPKHWFVEQIQQYDQACQDGAIRRKEPNDG